MTRTTNNTRTIPTNTDRAIARGRVGVTRPNGERLALVSTTRTSDLTMEVYRVEASGLETYLGTLAAQPDWAALLADYDAARHGWFDLPPHMNDWRAPRPL